MHKEISMYCKFLDDFYGMVHFLERYSKQNQNVDTDSQGSFELRYGAYFSEEWCFYGLPKY